MFVIIEKYVQLMTLVPFSRERFRESAYLDPLFELNNLEDLSLFVISFFCV